MSTKSKSRDLNKESCGPGNHTRATPFCADCGVNAEEEKLRIKARLDRRDTVQVDPSKAVQLIAGIKKHEVAQRIHDACSTLALEDDFEVLIDYIDYLECVARDFHMHAEMIAKAAGGAVPEKGIWKSPQPKDTGR